MTWPNRPCEGLENPSWDGHGGDQARARAHPPLASPEPRTPAREGTNHRCGGRRARPGVPHRFSGTETTHPPLPDGGGCFPPLRPGGCSPERGGGIAPVGTAPRLPPQEEAGGGGGDPWEPARRFPPRPAPAFLLPARLMAAAPPSPTRRLFSVGLKEERAVRRGRRASAPALWAPLLPEEKTAWG